MHRHEFLNRFQLGLHGEVDRGILTNGKSAMQFQPAAVLVPLVERPSGLHMLLTRRSAHLRHHASQICFPGGKFEVNDTSPEHTAIREAEEEVALCPEHVQTIGRLPCYYSISGFEVTPVVALIADKATPRVNSDEVAEVFEAPCNYLFDLNNHHYEWFKRGDRRLRVYYLRYKDQFIWGMTAALIQNLAQQLELAPA
jgi:8-oxo-dGTP pyrophosphatase MutT (NUDIX family)